MEELGKRFAGPLLQPGAEGYEAARRVHNGMIDKRPGLIAQCSGVADIQQAINFARGNSLEISIKGGGHNVAGRAVCDGGLTIDLSLMKGVLVDPKGRTVRAQGGVTWGEFNRETQVYGLATTGGVVSTTGIAGLTLGGGLGWLMGKYGLAVDNLLSVQVVTADGEILHASQNENSDLFWALRGGGGNFGVAASFEYQLHQVGPTITGGLVVHAFDKAGDVLRFYRDFTAALPDELSVFAGLLHAPDGSGNKIAAMLMCHCGTNEEASAAVQPAKEFGSPLMDVVGPMPYSDMNTLFDAGFPKGALNYWKSGFLRELSDDAIDTAVEEFGRCPSPMSGMLLEHFHGAATGVPAEATAFPHRDPGFNLVVISEWTNPSENDQNIAWAREAYDAMAPFTGSGRYVNYLGDVEEEDALAGAFGPNYARLRQVKKQYDPSNLFHLNQNIPPA
ncbi:MAG: hypothetical protein BZY88_09480 [SAR202 cluster bacterium Io17-Chloro-G9]|nr:MAG: hypothetical protein BZY88_09480 [SAR202 cluster bacterium Io17-Chloro-G9]